MHILHYYKVAYASLSCVMIYPEHLSYTHGTRKPGRVILTLMKLNDFTSLILGTNKGYYSSFNYCTHPLNLRTNLSLNHRVNSSHNYRTDSFLKNRTNSSLNSRTNVSLYPGTTASLNSRTNSSLNPRTNSALGQTHSSTLGQTHPSAL